MIQYLCCASERNLEEIHDLPAAFWQRTTLCSQTNPACPLHTPLQGCPFALKLWQNSDASQSNFEHEQRAWWDDFSMARRVAAWMLVRVCGSWEQCHTVRGTFLIIFSGQLLISCFRLPFTYCYWHHLLSCPQYTVSTAKILPLSSNAARRWLTTPKQRPLDRWHKMVSWTPCFCTPHSQKRRIIPRDRPEVGTEKIRGFLDNPPVENAPKSSMSSFQKVFFCCSLRFVTIAPLPPLHSSIVHATYFVGR